MDKSYQALIQAIKNHDLYDFISNNGHNYSKTDLINIIKELDYAFYRLPNARAEYSIGMDDCADNLSDLWAED